MTRSGVYLEYGAGRGGYARAERIDFDGVLSVIHSHSLQTAEEERYGSAAAFVSNTRTLPETLLLEVILSSAQPGAADADSRLQALMRLRAERTLCRVHTPAREYADMLLTDLTVTRDASCPCGWSGALTFTCAAPPGANALARDSRGSVCVCGGEAYALPADAETVRRLLTAAGASPAETGAAAEGGAVLLPLDPAEKRQRFTLDLKPGGRPARLRIDLRYLSAPDRWYIRFTDADTETPLTPAIPLTAGAGNDLLAPFGHLYRGAGLGRLYIVPAGGTAGDADPAEHTLGAFAALWTA